MLSLLWRLKIELKLEYISKVDLEASESRRPVTLREKTSEFA